MTVQTNHEFSESDYDKLVVLANGKVARIISVIREFGQVYDIYGTLDDDILIWNHLGHSLDISLNIVAVLEKK